MDPAEVVSLLLLTNVYMIRTINGQIEVQSQQPSCV